MKYFIAFLLIILLLYFTLTPIHAEPKWHEKLDGKLKEIIKKENAKNYLLSVFRKEKNVDVIVWIKNNSKTNIHNKIKHKFSVIPAVSMSIPVSKIKTLAENPDIEKINYDKMFRILRIESIPLIRADTATNIFSINGTGINISILDTGIYNHTEFQTPNRIILQHDFYNNDNNATDDNGHGTHVAGIAAGEGGNGRGVAANASIFAVKVCGATDADGCPESDIIAGIDWSLQNHAQIISMSLGGATVNCDDALVLAVDNATEQGVLVVVAAGNSGPENNTIASPACAKTAVAVGAAYDNDYSGVNYSSCFDPQSSSKTDNITCFSSRGNTNDNRIKPDIVAPGSLITSTYNNGDYEILAGTSMAAPFVSGVAALVIEQYNKTLGYFPEPGRVKAILMTAVNTTGMQRTGFSQRNNYYGSGRIDAYKALQILNYTKNATLAQGEQKMYYINVTKNNATVTLYWPENTTTSNDIDLIVGNETNNFTYPANPNDNVEQLFLRNVTSGIWKIYVNGTSILNQQKFYLASDFDILTDIYAPKWSNNKSTNANYSKNGIYVFNITWIDDSMVDEVVFEFNGTNKSYLSGEILKYGNIYSANVTDLTAEENYTYRWFANDSTNKWNSSDIWTYSINKSLPVLEIYFNGTKGNITIASEDVVNTTIISNGEGNITLYIDNSISSTKKSPIYNISNYTGNPGDVFNITAFYNSTQNFTSLAVSSFIIIDNSPPDYYNVSVYPASPTGYENSYMFNITWHDETNISVVVFEWNKTKNITITTFYGNAKYNSSREYYNIMNSLPIGNYTYRWIANDSMNNINSTEFFEYNISKAPSLIILFLNGTQSNATYTIGDIINITADINITGKNITIESNFSGTQIIANGTAPLYNTTNTANLASGLYNITAYFEGDENYTRSSQTYYIGLCPVCPQPSSWSACSGGLQTRTVYSCNHANYACQSSVETQKCSVVSSSSSGSSTSLSTSKIVPAEKLSINKTNEITTATLSNFAAGKEILIPVNNTIEDIEIESENDITRAEIKILYPKTIKYPAPEREVYNYIKIEKQNLTNINKTTIRFFVNKSWIKKNNINTSTIILERYSNGWKKLNTTKTGEDFEKLWFKSVFSGLSLFAVTGEKIHLTGLDANKTKDNKTSIQTTIKILNKIPEEHPKDKKNFIILITVIVIIILSATLTLLFLQGKMKFRL